MEKMMINILIWGRSVLHWYYLYFGDYLLDKLGTSGWRQMIFLLCPMSPEEPRKLSILILFLGCLSGYLGT